MTSLAADLEQQYPESNEDWGVALRTVRQMFPGPTDTMLIWILMLVMFLAAALFNLARGHYPDCGCFSDNPDPLGWGLVIRDVVMLAAAAAIIFGSRSSSRTIARDNPGSQ